MNTWHGLNHKQWAALFEGWQHVVIPTLYEVIRSPDADFKTRLFALQTWNEAILEGRLPPAPDFPQLLRDTLAEIALGQTRSRWWGRRRRRKKLHARLAATRWLLGTIGQFPAPELAKPEFPTEQREVDMSSCS